eukprot:TRINITY_DN51204_c0_g1_i1.p1 TRINITY_DN51204_c0_g1~~TRINITY_DN51204_c0_g1_i1.p1  ORF type:complete len:294 (+),score=22.11 TRINITY_DN51204_c0_g1_i1:74-955(+)
MSSSVNGSKVPWSMSYSALPLPFRQCLAASRYCTALEAIRLEMACRDAYDAAQVEWTSGFDPLLYTCRDVASRQEAVPVWRKALPRVHVAQMRSMAYLRIFAQSELSEFSPARDVAIGDVLEVMVRKDPSLLTSFLHTPGEACIIALPSPRETFGHEFRIESIGRIARPLPIFLQVWDKKVGLTNRRRITLEVFGHVGLLFGKRVGVTVIPASPHAWGGKVRKEDVAAKLPLKFVLSCNIEDESNFDVARLIVVFISISNQPAVSDQQDGSVSGTRRCFFNSYVNRDAVPELE